MKQTSQTSSQPGLPSDSDPELTDEMIIDAMQRAVQQFPSLTIYGFGISPFGERTKEAREAKFLRGRADLFDSKDQFRAAYGWLARQPRTKNVNPAADSSYVIKHLAETEIGYVANGVFIAAAIACGFRVQPADCGSVNAFLNISSRIWRGRSDVPRSVSWPMLSLLLDLSCRPATTEQSP